VAKNVLEETGYGNHLHNYQEARLIADSQNILECTRLSDNHDAQDGRNPDLSSPLVSRS
jgi:hypothetical protein